MAQEANDLQPDLTPQPESGPDLEEIRDQMDETRTALGEKLETLQEKVAGSVEAAQSKVEKTVETVQRTLDLKYQMSRHPWLMLGASLLAGYALGRLGSNPRRDQRAIPAGTNGAAEDGRLPGSAEHEASSRPPNRNRNRLLSRFDEEIDILKKVAIEAGVLLVREWLKPATPALSPQPHGNFHNGAQDAADCSSPK